MSSLTPKSYWMYGIHAVKAALENPMRQAYELCVIQEKLLQELVLSKKTSVKVHLVDQKFFQKTFGSQAVHQGVALKVSPLPEVHLEDITKETKENLTLLTLDQVTDPHNLGAILRSAAAFGVRALIVQDRHTPPDASPVLLKSASGAAEYVPIVRVGNLARALESLSDAGFWHYGLDERGDHVLGRIELKGRINLVLGSEGEGLRRLTKESCDYLLRLPTSESFATLNVSNAAAVSLYEVFRQNNPELNT